MKRCESFVRKGSYQTRLVRKDIDRIFNNKVSNYSFDNKVRIFLECDGKRVTSLREAVELTLPSEDAEKEIRQIIALKESEDYIAQSMRRLGAFGGLSNYADPFSSSYADRDVHTLKKNLAELAQDYQEDDGYTLFEEHSSMVNFHIFNEADRYIEDASVELTIHGDFVFLVANKIYNKPRQSYLSMPNIPTWEESNYPRVVELNNEKCSVYSSIGQIRHNLESQMLDVPLRIHLPNGSCGKNLIVDFKVYGKNLPIPIGYSLKIEILPVVD